MPRLSSQVSRHAHAKQFKRMNKALSTLRFRVGRVMRDVERQIEWVAHESRPVLQELIAHTQQIMSQRPKDKNKLYAFHAPEVECISKGKARQPYEFSVKVSITTTHKEGLVVGAHSMPGNTYDGHTLAEALEQTAILSEVTPEMAIVDRGYKGVAIEGVKIYHPGLRRGITRTLSAFAESIAGVTEKSLADFADHLDSHGRGDFVLGAFDDANHLIGIVGFYRAVHAKKAHKGTLWGMYVTPDRRQQGIGCALVSAAIERARNLPDILHITLCVTTSNEAARRLYESKGFRVYGIEQNAIHVDGAYLDEALMQL